MPTAITIWSWVMFSTNPLMPNAEPWVTFDHETEQICEAQKALFLDTMPERKAWCVPRPKPEVVKKVAKKRTVKKPVAKKRTTYQRTARR